MALLFWMLTAGVSLAQGHPYAHFHHALWELRDAHKELKEAKHDYGGHREDALISIRHSIKHLEDVLEYKHVKAKGVPTRGDLAAEYRKYKHHPHLHHALHEVKHAHHQMEQSKDNFGGHRESALRDMHEAIRHIELCLKHAK
jgi:hypothetical protein